MWDLVVKVYYHPFGVLTGSFPYLCREGQIFSIKTFWSLQKTLSVLESAKEEKGEREGENPYCRTPSPTWMSRTTDTLRPRSTVKKRKDYQETGVKEPDRGSERL